MIFWFGGYVYTAHGAVVVNTWPFTHATEKAYAVLNQEQFPYLGTTSRTVLDAVQEGCNICELEQCDFTVGYGGSPDSNGETTLDAMIMDGQDQAMGAVAYLRRVKDAIKVARFVLTHSAHSILAGEGALEFAKMMGFREEPLDSKYSRNMFLEWKKNMCQPNYFKSVLDQNNSCPPYRPMLELDTRSDEIARKLVSYDNHDTIGMVSLFAFHV